MFSKRTVRRILIALAVLGLIAAGGIWYLNWMMRQPLYVLGSVAAGQNLRGPLQPPKQDDPDVWQVETDISLSFAAFGEGEPVLVVHGGPGIPYANAWKGLEPLTDTHKFYYYHQRGCGDSTRPFDRFESGNFYQDMTELERTLGLGAQIADIERIRRILGRDKITLIGHSFGGLIATLYAAEFPDRVEKLVLVAPAGVLTPPDEDRNLFDQARAKLDEQQQPEFDALLKEYLDFGSIFSKSESDLVDLQQRLGKYLLEAMGYDADELSAGPRGGGWAVFAMYFSLGLDRDFGPALARVKAPTLIIHGKDDTMSLAGARSYQPIPRSKFALVDRDEEDRRAGHFLFDDSPVHFAEAVREFPAE